MAIPTETTDKIIKKTGNFKPSQISSLYPAKVPAAIIIII